MTRFAGVRVVTAVQAVVTTVAALFALTLVPGLTGSVAAAGSGLPYQDPSVVGGIGLCDAAGHQITQGSVSAAPFVWRAVSTVPPAQGYGAAGRTATLYAYQPRVETPPGDWSGQQLTASTRYGDPDVPIAAGTARDDSLGDFLSDYPPLQDGLIQLRIYDSAPGLPADSVQYAATDLRISGNTWTQVESVHVDCSAGSAVSVETILLSSVPSGHSGKGVATAKAARTGTAAAAAVATSTSAIAPAADHTAGSVQWVWFAVAGLCLVLLALTPLIARRRRAQDHHS